MVWGPSLRAIAARLQAEYIPPLRPISLGRTRTQQVAQPSPRTGKGDRVSGGRGPWTDGQGLYSIGSPHKRCSPACGGAKRGMPVASPGVARRAERGPWAKFRAYFDLHRNDKLLRAFTPSVSCADSFPNLIRQPSAATFSSGEGSGTCGTANQKPSPCSGARKRGMPVASPSGDRVSGG